MKTSPPSHGAWSSRGVSRAPGKIGTSSRSERFSSKAMAANSWVVGGTRGDCIGAVKAPPIALCACERYAGRKRFERERTPNDIRSEHLHLVPRARQRHRNLHRS